MNELWPVVSLGPWGRTDLGVWSENSWPFWRNPEFFARSRTPIVRMWVSWEYLAPEPADAFVDPATNQRSLGIWGAEVGQPYEMRVDAYVAWIDENIRQARRAGKHVILTFWRTPYWANQAMRASGPRPVSQDDTPVPIEYAPPDDLSATSPWAYMVWWLASRYNPYNPNAVDAWVFYLEICNEPNLQWWPQVTYGGDRRLGAWAAQMMSVARYVTSYTGDFPIVLGPALSDTVVDSSTRTSVDTFVTRMFAHFDAIGGWRGDDYIAWSHHNYSDVEEDLFLATNNRTFRLRQRLVLAGWTGFPPNHPQDPVIALTEGGVRGASDQLQLDRERNAWLRMQRDDGLGTGVATFTNYTMWSDFGDESCGLLQWVEPTSSYPGQQNPERPMFYEWANLPTSAPR